MRGHRVDAENPPVAGSNPTEDASKSTQFAGEIQCRSMNTGRVVRTIYCIRTKTRATPTALTAATKTG